MGQAHNQITSWIALRSSSTGSIKKGTTSFEAPEVFLEKTKTFQSDIYSFAMVMYEMLYPDISFPWEKEFSCGSVYDYVWNHGCSLYGEEALPE
jgi:serine/threonine protein kinase